MSDSLQQKTVRALSWSFKAVLIRSVPSKDDPYKSGQYWGKWLATLLVQHGVPEEQLTALFPIVVEMDRTYSSALAVKQWLAEQGLSEAADQCGQSGTARAPVEVALPKGVWRELGDWHHRIAQPGV